MNPDGRPQVLFVCVHNAGRSQMAAALLDRAADGGVDVRSAGSEPADALNWELEDPAGKDLETVRRIRDEIAGRVEALAGELLAK